MATLSRSDCPDCEKWWVFQKAAFEEDSDEYPRTGTGFVSMRTNSPPKCGHHDDYSMLSAKGIRHIDL